MDKILSLSDESVEKMNEIIWSLNRGDSSLEELIYHIRSQVATMVSNASLVFTYRIPEAIPVKSLNWNTSRHIYLLTKEAVNNALKHAEASVIHLQFEMQDSQLSISVADNGKGFDKTIARRDGNGLKSYEKRTASLNGTYQIRPADGGGTVVSFEIGV